MNRGLNEFPVKLLPYFVITRNVLNIVFPLFKFVITIQECFLNALLLTIGALRLRSKDRIRFGSDADYRP